MHTTNSEIVEQLNRMADLLEIQAGNPFRVRAYRNAARSVESLAKSIEDMIARGEKLDDLPGIGEDLAGKIGEIVGTGRFAALTDLEGKLPRGITELLKVKTLGPKRVAALHTKLEIADLKSLESAAKSGAIRKLNGFGEKTERSILESLSGLLAHGAERILLPVAEEWAREIQRYLEKSGAADQVSVAGSLRRRMETIGDLDFLATSAKPAALMNHFVKYPKVKRILEKGETRSTVEMNSGLQVDLRVVANESYGAAMYYFTGSKAHNIALRAWAMKRGYKVNEYGVFRGRRRVAGASEKEIFALFGMDIIPPELRENQGELEAARKHQLPRLIELGDIKGDLHAHTKRTDGRASLSEMAFAAKARGYEYLAITDHTKNLSVTHGQTAKELARQLEEIDRFQARAPGIIILKSAEVDILDDGSLDLPASALKKLDIVVCALHSHFDLSREQQTRRLLRALANPYCHILAHPSTRLIGKRKPCDFDWEVVFQAVKTHGAALEVNGQPERLDLAPHQCRVAVDMGIPLALSTDSHDTTSLDYMRFAVGQARRGWVEAKHVLNTRPLKELKALLRKP